MKAGLVLAALLGLADVGLPFSGDDFPPRSVAVAVAGLGLITLAAVAWAWRTGSRTAVWVVIGSRTVSALTALPAFFVSDVPVAVRVAAGAVIALTVLAVAPLARSPRPVGATIR